MRVACSTSYCILGCLSATAACAQGMPACMRRRMLLLLPFRTAKLQLLVVDR
jgi:hypothetical protein